MSNPRDLQYMIAHIKDPAAPTMAELQAGMVIGYVGSTNKKEENMASVNGVLAGGGLASGGLIVPKASVLVSDLLVVYPELLGHEEETEQEFANNIARAAQHARGEDALVELRDRIHAVQEEASHGEFAHGYKHGALDVHNGEAVVVDGSISEEDLAALLGDDKDGDDDDRVE